MSNANIYQFEVKDISGQTVPLSQYEGQALLIVNTASKCGFTPQYDGLEDLYQKYKDRGFAVLAFPCNQFGAQEPGDEAEIQNFCTTRFSTSFPLFSKVDVNGKDAAPLFEYLKASLPGFMGTKNIKWNFTKFLVDKNGQPVKRFAPKDKPEALTEEIEKVL